MRVLDLYETYRDEWRQRLTRTLLRYKNRYGRDEHIEPGHTYRDMLSGEELTVESVGSQVSIHRNDADARTEWSTAKEWVQLALDVGLLKHDQRRCTGCPLYNRKNQ